MTTYAYDGLDRLTSEAIVLNGAPVSRDYTYNARGNLASSVDRDGRVRTYLYDKLDRRKAEIWIGGVTAGLHWQYDNLGRVIARQDDDGSTQRLDTFVYDDLGRVIEQRNFDPDDPSGTTVPKVVQRWDYDELVYGDPDHLVRTIYTQHTLDGTTESPIGTTTTFNSISRHRFATTFYKAGGC